jgi:tetratricopeptide (TPR) repeat protein
VLELLPSLVSSFHKLGMELEADKSRFMKVKVLLQLGRAEECLTVLASLRDSAAVRGNRTLLGHVLVHAGNCFGSLSQFDEASRAYSEALPVLQGNGPSSGLAQLKVSIGDTYREQNHPAKALEAYRAAQDDFATIEMPTYVALLHLVIAEVLISIGRHREAEWEILAALPTIDEHKMVPEGYAAVALLRDSVRLRKTDPNALRELRERLQASK